MHQLLLLGFVSATAPAGRPAICLIIEMKLLLPDCLAALGFIGRRRRRWRFPCLEPPAGRPIKVNNHDNNDHDNKPEELISSSSLVASRLCQPASHSESALITLTPGRQRRRVSLANIN